MDGLIVFNKPKGISSFSCLNKIKKKLNKKIKIGHAGTLDPIATGVLLVCLGEATKLSNYLMSTQKEYQVRAKLGQQTDTFDIDGKFTNSSDYKPSIDEVNNVLSVYRGDVLQFPPMYSAIKHKGKCLYEYARKGEHVDIKQRTINIEKLELLAYEYPFLDLKVTCSKGTYIRSLVDEIGLKLKTYAYVAELERLRSGVFTINNSWGIDDELSNLKIYSIDEFVPKILPYYLISKTLASRIARGYQLTINDVKSFIKINSDEVPKVFSLFVEVGGQNILNSIVETKFSNINDIITASDDSKMIKILRVFNYSTWTNK